MAQSRVRVNNKHLPQDWRRVQVQLQEEACCLEQQISADTTAIRLK
jgi:hypothetical protein